MDDYSDDGFDEFNDTVLQELERNAVQSTQAKKASPIAFPELEDDDLDDALVVDQSLLDNPALNQAAINRSALNQSALNQSTFNQTALNRSPRNPSAINQSALQSAWNQSLRPPPPPRPAWYPSQHLPPPPIPVRPQQPSRFVPPPTHPSQNLHAQPSRPPHAAPEQSDILVALQAQLSALQSELTSARGETAILRSKYSRSQADHQAEVERLRRLNAEQLGKQDRAIEAALVAERQATTELQFARQDLKEELGRVKQRRRDTSNIATTPKKNRSFGAGDGFDTVEILPSPSKGHRRKDPGPVAVPVAERTPTRGKRKRPVASSPAMALEIMGDDPAPSPSSPVSFHPRPKELPFDFLKLVLDHSPLHGQPLTFDLFARYVFPSDPNQSFAAIILDKLPSLGTSADPVHLLIDFCEMLLDLWNRCIREKYHQPLFDVAALLSFALQLDTLAVAPHIAPTLLPLAQTTCFLVAIPRFASADGDLAAHPDASVRRLGLEIDVTHFLGLLYLAALACPSADSASYRAEFWKRIQLGFVFLMLSPKQAPEHFFAMLALLRTSVLPDSIGPIGSSEDLASSGSHRVAGGPENETPEFVALALAERISFYLADPPRWAGGSVVEQCRVRLALLRTLAAFAGSPFGAAQLAASPVAVPRLASVLCWAVDCLYDMEVPGLSDVDADPDATQEVGDQGTEATTSDLSAVSEDYDDPTDLLHQLIAQLTQLLHALVANPRTAEAASVAGKMAASRGGYHRYLLTLARISFAEEGLVLEAGISAETAELAHDLLELAVTPEEGNEIGEVFGP